MKLSNLKVGTRLMAGFGLLIVLLIAIGATGLLRMAQIESRLETIVQQNVAKSNLAMKMRQSLDDRMIALRNLALLAEDHEIASESARIKFANTTYAKVQGELEQLMNQVATEEEKNLLASIKKHEATAATLIAKAVALGMEHRTTEITALLIGELRPVQREWASAMTQLIEYEDQRNDELMQEAQASFAMARLWMLGLSLLAVLLGITTAVLITRSLLGQLGGEPRSAMEVAVRIAGGDLAVKVPVRAKDRTSLMAALEDMRARLAGLVVQVRGGTEAIATASAQIASGNMDLSSRTEQQASSLEETASAMEELTSTVRQNADNARQANQLAENASDVAAQGGAVVSQVVDTMGAINQSARKIADIIGVIDGIAFQTNILALNAAVEAARAGEQGRGFAVVATEVRSLAQRSAAAAKEIKTLIGDSVDKVSEGSALVDKAGATMHEVVSAVRRVTDIMGEITAASQEQSAGIEQVNQAVSQMDQVTQQNAALVEEAAAASASMQEQSNSLAALVANFKVDAHGPAVAVAAAAPQVRTPVPALPQAEAAASRPPARPAPQSGRNAQAAGEDREEF